METIKEEFTKQCGNHQPRIFCEPEDSKSDIILEYNEHTSTPSCSSKNHDSTANLANEKKYSSPESCYEEPIDLTFTKKNISTEKVQRNTVDPPCTNLIKNNSEELNGMRQESHRNPLNYSVRNIENNHFIQYVPSKRKFRRKNVPFYPNPGKPTENTIHTNAVNGSFQNSDAKHAEVLKAAKSLFSKRTRTLYHWMYPNAPKQQIKAAVVTSWESLGTQEKEFYISQVLGRFGFPQCSLMINPQLGGIKELPPLPDLTEFNNTPGSELQNAISSISAERSNYSRNSLNDANCDSMAHNEKRKRRLGRPPGSKNKKIKEEDLGCSITQDFQDDPELSKELQQFAITLNMH